MLGGLFLIGVGVGMAIGGTVPIPDILKPFAAILWFVLILAGVVLIIKSHN